MKKVAAVFLVLAMLGSFAMTAWSLNEAQTQRTAARAAEADLARLQAEYDALTAAMQGGEEQTPAVPADDTAGDVVDAAAPVEGLLTREEADALAAQYKTGIQVGSSIGRIWIEGTNVDCGLYWGDTQAIFNLGGGSRAEDGCVLPGENGTVCVGGHTGSYFSDLGSAQVGAIIHLETPWGDFRYKISSTNVVQETDIDAFYWGATQPRCVLYTCYPFGMLEHTPQRYVVYGDPLAADAQGVLPCAPASLS